VSLEVALRANLAVDLIDVDGRPLGEVGSTRYDRQRTELVSCPFADRRRGMPMNASALAQLRDTWKPLLSAAGALSDGTALGAWRACIGLVGAPVLFALAHPDQPVPRPLSAGYKAALGFTQTLTHLLLQGSDRPWAVVNLEGRLDELATVEAVRIGEVRRGAPAGLNPWLMAAKLHP